MANIVNNDVYFTGKAKDIQNIIRDINQNLQGQGIDLDKISGLDMNTRLYSFEFVDCNDELIYFICDTRWSPITELSQICDKYNLKCDYKYWMEGDGDGRMVYNGKKEIWY